MPALLTLQEQRLRKPYRNSDRDLQANISNEAYETTSNYQRLKVSPLNTLCFDACTGCILHLCAL